MQIDSRTSNRFKDALNSMYTTKITEAGLNCALRLDAECEAKGTQKRGKFFRSEDFIDYCRQTMLDNLNDDMEADPAFSFEMFHYVDIIRLENDLKQLKEVLEENKDIIGIHTIAEDSPLFKFHYIWRAD